MTAREMIDSLSGTLLCDDRILSVPERDLLANLLQRTQTRTSGPGNDVAEAITRTVGEIIAERALGVLGESMTRQLLQQQFASSLKQTVPVIRAGTPGTPPPSPSPGTRPPGTSPPPISAGTPELHHRVLHREHARQVQARRRSARAPRNSTTESFTGNTPARYKPAAHFVRDRNLATEDGRSRRAGGGRLFVRPMCGARRVPHLDGTQRAEAIRSRTRTAI